MFDEPPDGYVPIGIKEYGPDLGTPWRRANWRFFEDVATTVSPEQRILDVGAGQGRFRGLFQNFFYIGQDVYPYEAIDVVCRLEKRSPFQQDSFDFVLLSNVLEHIAEGFNFITALASVLRPGGKLVIAVPFMVGIHEPPHDFARYTHWGLAEMVENAGLQLQQLSAVYEPMTDAGHALARLSQTEQIRSSRRNRIYISIVGRVFNHVVKLNGVPEPVVRDVTDLTEIDPDPVGFHVVASKPG